MTQTTTLTINVFDVLLKLFLISFIPFSDTGATPAIYAHIHVPNVFVVSISHQTQRNTLVTQYHRFFTVKRSLSFKNINYTVIELHLQMPLTEQSELN